MTTWSNPTDKNWAVGDMGNAADLNQYQAANLSATMHRTVTMRQNYGYSSATLGDSPLGFPVLANEVWAAWFLPRVSVPGGGDWKIAFTCPTGTTFAFEATWTPTAGTLSHLIWSTPGGSAAFDSVSSSTVTAHFVPIWGVVRAGSTPGLFRMQIANNSGTGSNYLWKGSSVIAQRMSP